MKVLFVASGNHGGVITPIITNQGESLIRSGVEVEYYAKVGTGIKGNIRSVFDLRKQIKHGGYDVIHAHFWITAITASLAMIGLRNKIDFVVSLMGDDVKKSKSLKILLRLAALIFHWKKIMVKSQDMYNALGIKQAAVIPNGVNMDRFIPMDKQDCKNKLGWGTGIHVLFPANPHRDVKDYPLAKSAIELVNANEEVSIHAFENLPNEQTPYYYNAADVVLMTSKWEGSPNAIKEAMACNRPIVTVNVGDVKERLDGVDGCYVVDSRDPQQIAKTIQLALHYTTSKGREKLRKNELLDGQIAKKIIDLYNKN